MSVCVFIGVVKGVFVTTVLTDSFWGLILLTFVADADVVDAEFLIVILGIKITLNSSIV